MLFCVAQWPSGQDSGCWTCDQQVAGSNTGRRSAECNPGQVVYTYVPLSPSSIIWYQSQWAVMPCGWDGNRRSGVARITQGLGDGDDHPPTLSGGAW